MASPVRSHPVYSVPASSAEASSTRVEVLSSNPSSQRGCCSRLRDLISRIWKFLLEHTFLGRFFGAAAASNSVGKSDPITALREKYKDRLVEGKIFIPHTSTGYLGTDRRYEFGKKITLISGKALQTSPTDFYCVVYDQNNTIQLPSSLFSQARIEDKICFFKEGKLYILELEEHLKTHLSFDECVKAVHRELARKSHEFLYDEDVPPEYHRWCQSGSERIYLSPEAKRILLGETGLVPLDFQSLKPISSTEECLIEADDFQKVDNVEKNGKITYQIEFPGSWDMLDILVDRNRIYAHAFRQPANIPSNCNMLYDTSKNELLFMAFEDGKVDLSQGSAEFENGYLILEFPLT